MRNALPALRTSKIGSSTRINYDDVLKAAGRDPSTEPVERPKVVSIRATMEILQVSRATVNRMISRGREAVAA